MNFLYYMLINDRFPSTRHLHGSSALTDFGPMLRNLRLSIFGAAAQFGIFAVLLVAILMASRRKRPPRSVSSVVPTDRLPSSCHRSWHRT